VCIAGASRDEAPWSPHMSCSQVAPPSRRSCKRTTCCGWLVPVHQGPGAARVQDVAPAVLALGEMYAAGLPTVGEQHGRVTHARSIGLAAVVEGTGYCGTHRGRKRPPPPAQFPPELRWPWIALILLAFGGIGSSPRIRPSVSALAGNGKCLPPQKIPMAKRMHRGAMAKRAAERPQSETREGGPA